MSFFSFLFCFWHAFCFIKVMNIKEDIMKIAITTYNETISNVFDFAHTLLLITVDDGVEISRCEVSLVSQRGCRRLCQLEELEVDVLICGAISRNLGNMIMESGIKVLPYVTGSVENVLSAYLADELVNPEFSMPGHWQGARQGFCRGGGRGGPGGGRGGRGGQWRGGRR
jgi:predicted Fe-Mo cluster-binding NifX family protein